MGKFKTLGQDGAHVVHVLCKIVAFFFQCWNDVLLGRIHQMHSVILCELDVVSVNISVKASTIYLCLVCNTHNMPMKVLTIYKYLLSCPIIILKYDVKCLQYILINFFFEKNEIYQSIK